MLRLSEWLRVAKLRVAPAEQTSAITKIPFALSLFHEDLRVVGFWRGPKSGPVSQEDGVRSQCPQNPGLEDGKRKTNAN
jgi:hypothetical protein